MSFFESILLGIVQGITEFLPISSSGHLVIFQKILNFQEPPIFFDVVLHLATLTAVVIYFRHQIIKYFKPKNLKAIIIASLPAFLFGFLISSQIEKIFNSTYIVSLGLIITGLFMLLTKNLQAQKTHSTINNQQAFLIGSFQAIAIMPGISRSGSTIFGAMLNRISKQKAFEFSFILSIPAIIGALMLQIFSSNQNIFTLESLTGFIAALISGLVAIKFLDKIINNNKLFYFGYYCLTVGLITLILTV